MDKKQEDLVREVLASREVCGEWKDKIREAFPEIEIAHKKNVWYVKGDSPFLQHHENMYGENYGINHNGEWSTVLGCAGIRKFKRASKEIIETALVKEAKKRGLVSGTKLLTKWCAYEFTLDGRFEFEIKRNTLWAYSRDETGRYTVFADGEWAIAGISKKDAEEKLGLKIIG